MRIVANIISVIFHPLLLTSYLVLILGYYFPSLFMLANNKLLIILAFIFCFTFLLPVVNIIMFRMFGTINSYTMVSRKERILPFVVISLIYLLMTFMFFYRLPISKNLNLLMLIATMLVVCSTVLTFFYKVSVHSLAIWGGVGILLPLNKAMEQSNLLWPTAIALVIAGLVMSSRLYLNAHTPSQVMVGSLAGFTVGFFGVTLLY